MQIDEPTGTPETESSNNASFRRTRRWCRRTKLLVTVSAIYAASVAAITIADLVGPETWWWSTLNLYLPQWLWALPGAVLLSAYVLFARRLVAVPLVLIAWVLGPMMGLRLHFAAGSAPAGALRLRVMTFNTKWFKADHEEMEQELRQIRPDVLVLQEADFASALVSRALPGYSQQQFKQFLIASRFPIRAATPHEEAVAGGSASWLECRVDADGREVDVQTVHLVTPRVGLSILRHSRGQAGEGELEGGASLRLGQAAVVARAAGTESVPCIVAGDFNAPVQSLVCQAFFDAGFTDAFDQAGSGYGYTYGHSLRLLRHSFVRIDHVMASRQWRILDCWAAAPCGSDHRPVVSDLALSGG